MLTYFGHRMLNVFGMETAIFTIAIRILPLRARRINMKHILYRPWNWIFQNKTFRYALILIYAIGTIFYFINF